MICFSLLFSFHLLLSTPTEEQKRLGLGMRLLLVRANFNAHTDYGIIPPSLSPSLLPLPLPPCLPSLPIPPPSSQAYAVLIFWFQLFNAFSGSNPIDTVNLLIFNLVYTSLPILAVAIIDQDLPKEMLLADKHYYKQGRCSEVYTRFKFWLTMIDAFYESAVVFFMAFVVGYATV